MIYLDSSAIVKLANREQHSPELVAWLSERQDMPLVASALIEIEVQRALRRTAPHALATVPGLLARLYRLEIDATIRSAAAAFVDPGLRSLDAIHLATAWGLSGELTAFVTYDMRLLATTERLGLPVAIPGAKRS